MSWRALLLAVRDRIRVQCGYEDAVCDVTFDGRPHPSCGPVFVAIHKGSRSNRDAGTGRVALDQRYEVQVTVTMRQGPVPFDRLGTDLMIEAVDGLEPRVDAIIAAVQQDAYDHVIVRAANAMLASMEPGPPLGFVLGLAYLSDGPEREVGGRWFHATGREQAEGIATTIRFGGARRIQSLLNMNGVEWVSG